MKNIYIVTLASLPPSARAVGRSQHGAAVSTEPAPVPGAVVPTVGGSPGGGGRKVVEGGGGGGGRRVVLVVEGGDCDLEAVLVLEVEAEAVVVAAAAVPVVSGLPCSAVSGWDGGRERDFRSPARC